MRMKRVMMIAALAAILGVPRPVAAEAPTLSVESVAFRQRYPWNGLVDIDCKVNCVVLRGSAGGARLLQHRRF